MSEKRAMPVAIYHACEECGDEFELLVQLDSGTKLYTHPAPVEALETLFRHYDLNDLDERDEDDVIEIPVRDLRAARAAFLRASNDC